MADTAKTTKTDKTAKPSFYKGLKAEFNKIIWPNREDLTKQTIAVVSISVVLSIVIAVLDKLVQFGLNFIIK